MKFMIRNAVAMTLCLALVGTVSAGGNAWADSGHGAPQKADDHDNPMGMMDSLRQEHREHEHGHDFEAMEQMSPEQMGRMITLMREIGLATPPMDAERGRKLFAETGCAVCHTINGVGGDLGPSLNAADMPSPMNAFEFSARMWRGAPAMAALQEDFLGGFINLTGQDLADLVAFAHDEREQAKLTDDQIPEQYRELIDE